MEPLGLFFLNQHWYLAGRTPGEEPVKNYRVNRITDLTINPSRPGTPDYDIPASFNLREHARSRQAWELGAADAVDAVVHFRVNSGAAAAAIRLGEEVADRPESRRFRVRRTDAFARWLLSYGGDIVPVSPRELVDEYRGLIRETLDHHSSTGGPSDRPSPRPPVRPSSRPPVHPSP